MTRAVKIFAFALICGLFAVSVCAGVLASQQAAADPAAAQPTASNQFAILVTTIAGFASLLATHLFQFYREGRNRRWDLQDRMSARQEMRNHAETQRVETLKTAIELARVSNINREHLLGAIKENTELTSEAGAKAEAAYTSANNFNEKLESLHRELAGLAKKLPPEAPRET
jgi:uncharacterized protein involved in exopolysaccharide biosynthesis